MLRYHSACCFEHSRELACDCSAMAMIFNKLHDAQEASLTKRDQQLVLEAYAHFLIVTVIELWLIEAANSKHLQQKLQEPGLDLWQYLRCHVNTIVQSVPSNWHINAEDVVHKIAADKLSSRISNLLQTVQPWEIVFRRCETK